jgi:hypothetical protein
MGAGTDGCRSPPACARVQHLTSPQEVYEVSRLSLHSDLWQVLRLTFTLYLMKTSFLRPRMEEKREEEEKRMSR